MNEGKPKVKSEHRLLDHTIISYFLLAFMVEIFITVGSYLDNVIGSFIRGYSVEITLNGQVFTSASGVGVAAASLLAVFAFTIFFGKEWSGCLKKENLKTGLLMLLPFLIFHYCGSVVSWFTFGIGGFLIPFLRALAPGFSEEVMFRGLGIANYMRTARSGRQIMTIFWLSSIVFGLTHLANILAGGDRFSVIIQSVYAIGVGMLFGAVYLRTGNLWPTIIGHTSVDFMEFVRADLSASGGIMTGMGIGDWITIAAAAFAAFWALRLMKPEFHQEILDLWAAKWHRDPADRDIRICVTDAE